MNTSISIDAGGRIVLPSAVRRRLNLVPGSRLSLAVVAERIELTPEAGADAALQQSPGKRTVLRPTGEPFDAAAAVRAERETQARRGRRR